MDDDTERYFREILGFDDSDIRQVASSPNPQAEAEDIAKRIQHRGESERPNNAEPYKKDTMNDNYGYLNKSPLLSGAGMLPGPMGLAGKMLNGAVNLSNAGAINEARSVLGMEPKSMTRGAFKDDKGYVGDITYGGVTSPVGFEAQTPDGRTTLTTNEARMRQELAGAKPSTETEASNNKANSEQNDPKQRGIFARAFGSNFGKNKPKKDAASQVRPTADYTEPSRRAPSINTGRLEDNTGFQRLPNVYGDPDLPQRTMADLSIDNKKQGRSELPSSDILSQVQDVVTDTIGPGATVHLKSGMEPEGRSPVGTKYRHPEGFAGDFTFTDAEGAPININDQQMKDIAQNAAGRYGLNFGAGMGYMGAETVHMDNMDLTKYPGAPQWGATGKAFADDLNKSRAQGVMAPSYYDVDAPAPTPRPDYTPSAAPTDPSVVANRYPSATGFADIGRTKSFDPDTRRMMAMTLAGEIDPSKTDLNTPQGIAEANGIMSTMENRAPKYGSVQAAITAPSAYSTWGTEQAARTADANYNANPQRYQSLVDNYATDVTARQGFTSYHNPSISNPGWSAKMEGVQDIGPHKFGSLPEFGQTNMSKVTQQVTAGPSMAPFQASASVDLSKPAPAASEKKESGFNAMKTSEPSKTSVSAQSSTGSRSPSSGGGNRGGGMTQGGQPSSRANTSSSRGGAAKNNTSRNNDDDHGSGGGGGGSGGGGW